MNAVADVCGEAAKKLLLKSPVRARGLPKRGRLAASRHKVQKLGMWGRLAKPAAGCLPAWARFQTIQGRLTKPTQDAILPRIAASRNQNVGRTPSSAPPCPFRGPPGPAIRVPPRGRRGPVAGKLWPRARGPALQNRRILRRLAVVGSTFEKRQVYHQGSEVRPEVIKNNPTFQDLGHPYPGARKIQAGTGIPVPLQSAS